MTSSDAIRCPLCGKNQPAFLAENESGLYWQCDHCHLIYQDPSQHLTREDEHHRYLLHENNPDDPRYRAFLRPVAEVVERRFPGKGLGLDFGCGPGPALAIMLQEQGYGMDQYDPFFFPAQDVLQKTYNFITCTEVLEHMTQPGEELQKLVDLLLPGGSLIAMTRFLANREEFLNNNYHRDPTHICFFNKQAFLYAGSELGMTTAFPAPNVVVFTKE